MFGQQIFGGLFGETSQLILESSNFDIMYNDFGLVTDKIIVNKFNWRNVGEIETNLYNLPRRDGKGFQSSFLRGKDIEISGTITASNQEEMETIINNLKTATSQPEKYLKFKNGETFWKAKAVRTGLQFDQQSYTLTYMPFTLNFKTTEAFWHEDTEVVKFLPNKNSNFVFGFDYYGNAPTFPKINIVFNEAASVTSTQIKINGVGITFSGSVGDLDILTFDGEVGSVLSNSIKQAYLGTFGSITPGYNTIEFIINGTYVSNISIIYKNNYE